jgi:signal transduction histidine kinase
VDGLRVFAAARGIRITAELSDEVPPVRVDLDRMVQVVTNLLSNAIKFSPAGGDVRVTAVPTPAGVEIRVIDHGCGIAAEDLPRLFQKFEQLDSPDGRGEGGTGLGLAICRGLVNEHGGALRVESVLGRGSTFTVTLPAEAGPAPEGAG